MSKLTTHVLDLVNGCPGSGIRIQLYRLEQTPSGEATRERSLVASNSTNADGRCDRPLLEGEAFMSGVYEIEFFAGDYFKSQGMEQAQPGFLDHIIIRFGISDPEQHYHVPLLLSHYGYSTYRGS